MKARCLCLILILVALSGVLAACGKGGPEAAPQAKAPELSGAARTAWDELVAAGQKEGSVTIYSTEIAPVTEPLRQAFKQRYNIDLEFVLGRTNEIVAKINAERRAGLYLADVVHAGETTSAMDMKPLGITVPLPPLMVLPEVKDPQKWTGGKLPLLDKDGHAIMFMAMAIPHMVINTDMVKDSDLASFLDILQPQWKGKLTFYDPTISGTSPNLLAVMYKTFGKEKATDIFRQLAAQGPAMTNDPRQMLEWVAKGKYAVGLGQSMALLSDFKNVQAPIKAITLKEPRMISAGPGTMVVLSNGAHPKATQVYINWILSQEGSTIWSKALQYVSTREDVTKEGLDPAIIPRPIDVFPDEEQLALRVEMRKVAAEIFGPLMGK